MASGGARVGAGRPKGTRNLRTVAATELLAQAQERFPDFNPIAALIALASEPDTDPVLAKECYVAVLPYMAPRFRPVEADIERLIELETRLARAKLEASAQLLHDRPDLADRLDRAVQRAVTIVVETGVPRTPDQAAPDAIEGLADRLSAIAGYAPPAERLSPPKDHAPAPAGETPAAPAAPPAKPAPAPATYAPILPEPAPLRFSQTMDPNYRPFED